MRIVLGFVLLILSLTVQSDDAELQAALTALENPRTVLIDVRTQAEVSAGAIQGSTRIGYEHIARQIAQINPDQDTPIVLYCESGARSGIAQKTLQAMGYRQVINAGGYDALAVALEQPH